MLLPGEGDRIYFAGSARQAIALVAAAIGVQDQEAEVAYLTRALARGPVSELRWRGYTRPGNIGQLAYISTGARERPAPAFALGAPVRFYNGTKPNIVSGVALYKDRLNYGRTQWRYSYEGAGRYAHPYGEAHTVAEPEMVAYAYIDTGNSYLRRPAALWWPDDVSFSARHDSSIFRAAAAAQRRHCRPRPTCPISCWMRRYPCRSCNRPLLPSFCPCKTGPTETSDFTPRE